MPVALGMREGRGREWGGGGDFPRPRRRKDVPLAIHRLVYAAGPRVPWPGLAHQKVVFVSKRRCGSKRASFAPLEAAPVWGLAELRLRCAFAAPWLLAAPPRANGCRGNGMCFDTVKK